MQIEQDAPEFSLVGESVLMIFCQLQGLHPFVNGVFQLATLVQIFGLTL
jgi:hypothetical protein